MRSIRRDPTTGRTAVIASERVHRPRGIEEISAHAKDASQCPFCPGNERATPPAIDVAERDGRWAVRAVPNSFPALVVEERLHRGASGPYDLISGTGAHEVIVESRAHAPPLWEQPREQMVLALSVARSRIADLSRDRRFHYVSWFRNSGLRAGASQVHPHAQIVAMPFIPPLVAEMRARAAHHWREHGRELMQDVLDWERDATARLVWDSGPVAAFCPFASLAPFETWLVPTEHATDFRGVSDDTLGALADGLRIVLRAIAAQMPDPSHTVTLFTAPLDGESPGFRWHLRIEPRLDCPGGFESGTGCTINGVPPEIAAKLLRGERG